MKTYQGLRHINNTPSLTQDRGVQVDLPASHLVGKILQAETSPPPAFLDHFPKAVEETEQSLISPPHLPSAGKESGTESWAEGGLERWRRGVTLGILCELVASYSPASEARGSTGPMAGPPKTQGQQKPGPVQASSRSAESKFCAKETPKIPQPTLTKRTCIIYTRHASFCFC